MTEYNRYQCGFDIWLSSLTVIAYSIYSIICVIHIRSLSVLGIFGYIGLSMGMQKWTSGKLEKWKNRNCKYGKLVMWEFGKMQKCKCGQVGQTDRQTSLCPSLCLSQLSTFALFRNPTFPILHFSTFPLFQFSTCWLFIPIYTITYPYIPIHIVVWTGLEFCTLLRGGGSCEVVTRTEPLK